MIRQPIVVVLGHTDHGKTTILDNIRGTRIQNKELGGITQSIGATEIPKSVILNVCKNYLKKDLNVPGLLFIDTPGHEVFTSLRERGGSVADLAILVIDINQGVQAQTIESMNILKTFKTPFIVVLNKIDLIKGWIKSKNYGFSQNLKNQTQPTKNALMEKVYEIMGSLSLEGFDSDLFNNITDYSKKIALIPASGISGEGILEILLTLSGLSSKYLINNLKINPKGEGKGSILEVKEVKGLGTVIDSILYDGKASVGDLMLFQGINEIYSSKIKAIFKPKPKTELRQTKNFDSLKTVSAATGVRISAPNLSNALSGTSIIINPFNEKKSRAGMNQTIKEIIFEKTNGVFIKADSIGSLEAMIELFKKENIPIQKTGIGEVNKKDAVKAVSIRNQNPKNGLILGFNIKINNDAKKILDKNNVVYDTNGIIYSLIETYQKLMLKLENDKKREILEKNSTPCLIQIKVGCVFRASNPCVMGVNVVKGNLVNNSKLMNLDGKSFGKVKGIQQEGKQISKAEQNSEVAISLNNVKAGKDFEENDFLITDLNEKEYENLLNNKNFLTSDEKQVLSQFIEIKRKQTPLFGIG